jgi:hypothetical protein
MSIQRVCLTIPWVPHRSNTHPVSESYRNFPPSGDLFDERDEDPALDSCWRLRAQSLVWGTGDPGRMALEIRKEHRDTT